MDATVTALTLFEGWRLLDERAKHHRHIRTGAPLPPDLTAFLLARGANSLHRREGMSVIERAQTEGFWLAAEIMRVWVRRGQTSGKLRVEMV